MTRAVFSQTWTNIQKAAKSINKHTDPPSCITCDTNHWDLKAKGLFLPLFSSLFLRMSTHSSWAVLKRQSRVWLNRSGSLTALWCVCFLHAYVYMQEVWLEYFISGHREKFLWPLPLASFSDLLPFPSYSTYISFYILYPLLILSCLLSLIQSRNSTQSPYLFIVLPVLFTFTDLYS